MKRSLATLILLVVLLWTSPRPLPAGQFATQTHRVEPGDTWVALAWRYGVRVADLQAANPHPNRQRQPAIGATIHLPAPVENVPVGPGRLVRANDGGLLATAARYQTSPWRLALLNGLGGPSRPLFYRPLLVPGGDEAPHDYPLGFDQLELSGTPAHAGEALALRATVDDGQTAVISLNDQAFTTAVAGNRLVALGGVGAFYPRGDHELIIVPDGRPAWNQPWRMADREWAYQQLTLSGAAAAIDAASIAAERERLFTLWSRVTPEPQWNSPFQLPIRNYLAISSDYGVRRSYNGGPFRSYHEGVDFSAYGGTPVYAPAGGTVVLAEFLYVRGGAVILDHGLGIYSGYYHLSEVLAEVGDVLQPGQVLGAVGTTGLSTGNHLHWDLLVAETWVDALAWLEQGLDCWLLEGLGRACGE